MDKIESIVIIGKRWFDKVNGNTYFSSVGLINGKEVIRIQHRYGYDSQYSDETFREMEGEGLLTDVIHHNNGSREPLWVYCKRKHIQCYVHVSDVGRKKDL